MTWPQIIMVAWLTIGGVGTLIRLARGRYGEAAGFGANYLVVWACLSAAGFWGTTS